MTNKNNTKQLLSVNFIIFAISAILGLWSRLTKTGYVNFEHILAGIGSPAFFFVLFVSIGIFVRKKYNITNKIQYFNISFMSSIAYIVVAILSEFFKSTNKENQFLYDLIGILIYMAFSYWYIQIREKKILKITFDSNVWRIIASPNTFPKEASIQDFQIIRQAINKKKISPFLCETIFTLEAIQRKKRKEFFSGYKAITSSSNNKEENTVFFSISPNESAHPGNNKYLESHLSDAKEIGFQIIKLPRIAGIVNPDIVNEKYFYKHKDLQVYFNNVFTVAKAIESKNAGFSHIKRLGEKYDKNWLNGIRNAPESENGNIAKAIAEWADGDSVACHIAIGGDYFCTRDIAKKAGDKSIFSEKNLKWLQKEFNFKIISPEELSTILEKNRDMH